MLFLLQGYIRPHALPVEHPPVKPRKRDEEETDEIFLAVWMMYLRQFYGQEK